VIDRIAQALVRVASHLVPSDQRAEWRREWETEMAWDRHRRLGGMDRLKRASGAGRHAV